MKFQILKETNANLMRNSDFDWFTVANCFLFFLNLFPGFMKKGILFFAALLVYGISVYAQQAGADFKKISAFYKVHSNFSQKMEYKTYKNYTDKTPFDVAPGELIKKGDLLYYRVGNNEQIRNLNYTLAVNHDAKTIVLLPRKVYGSSDFSSINYDTLLTFCKSVIYRSLPEGKASYTLEFNSGEYEKVTLHFDTKSYQIITVEYLLASRTIADETGKYASYKSKMVVQYRDFRSEVALTDDYFTYKRFLIKQHANRFVCTEAFRTYSFVNQANLH